MSHDMPSDLTCLLPLFCSLVLVLNCLFAFTYFNTFAVRVPFINARPDQLSGAEIVVLAVAAGDWSIFSVCYLASYLAVIHE